MEEAARAKDGTVKWNYGTRGGDKDVGGQVVTRMEFWERMLRTWEVGNAGSGQGKVTR